MDDLEHSVVIADREWDTFYEECEECSLAQAGLADLDDSGLSDTDDNKSSRADPGFPLQTQSSITDEEHGAKVQTQSNTGDSGDNECHTTKPDGIKPAEQSSISLINDSFVHTCLTSESSVSGNDYNPADQQQNSSVTKNLRQHDDSNNEDKSGLDSGAFITSSPCIKNAGRAAGSETNVTGDSTNPKGEKERWFVTVNDTPVQRRVKAGTLGQKKRRKKKNSRKLIQQSRDVKERCPLSKKEEKTDGEKIKEGQKTKKECEQSLPICVKSTHFNAFTSNVSEEVISASADIQKVDVTSVKKPGTDKVSFAFSFESKETEDVTVDNPENNLSASLSTQTPLFLTQGPHFQTDTPPQLANDQNTTMDIANVPESSKCIITKDQPSHVHNTRENNSTAVSSDKIDEQQKHSLEKYSSTRDTNHEELCIESLEASVDPAHPIYALSSFWDEMEKLTINDILQLRVSNNHSPFQRSVSPGLNQAHFQNKDLANCKDGILQDYGFADDTADSDYFTSSDYSKLDRSSCEFSTFSDFDEDFLQMVNKSENPSPEPHNVKEQGQNDTYIEFLPEQEHELTTINTESQSEDIVIMCTQDGIPLYLHPAVKTNSVLTSNKNINGNPLELDSIRKIPSPVLSITDINENQNLLNFPDLFYNDTEREGLQTRTSDSCSSAVSFACLSLPETYDDFFSDFEVGNLFFPSVQDRTVPIYSSSRSIVRDLVFPEVEEIVESDAEDNNSPIRVSTRFNCQSGRSTSPSGEPNIYFFTSKRRNWRDLFSIRRIIFAGKGSTWYQTVSSWIFPTEARKSASYISGAQPMPQLLYTGIEEAPLHFVEQQKHLQHTIISVSRKDGFPFSLKQADICLVCIAFASWVIKSSNPQSTDMWKTALLANVSTISAIQYLRQYVQKEGTKDDP